jgi:hypothetical protein
MSDPHPRLAFGNKAFGLIVGISSFQDRAYYQNPLPQAVFDAEDFALILQENLGWHQDNIKVLTEEVTKEQIRNTFKTLRTQIEGVGGADLFLFYISTHGHPYKRISEGDETVFLATNTCLSDPLQIADTGLTRHILGAYIDSIQARQKVIISDACFAASGVQVNQIAPPQPYVGIDAAVLSASVGKAYAVQERNSVFTSALLKSLRKWNGEIGIGGLADTISQTIPSGWPQPFLDTRGRSIVIGVTGKTALSKQHLTFDKLLHFSQSRLKLVSTRQGNFIPNDTGYVPRKTVESQFGNFLKSRSVREFSVVGPAGMGKSTVLLHLAEEAVNDKFPVLWFSGAYLSKDATLESLIYTAVNNIGEDTDLEQLNAILKKHSPLLVFVDAINEWNVDSEAIENLLSHAAEISRIYDFRIIYSCREEFWHQLNEKRDRNKEPKLEASVSLGCFDDDEFAVASKIYKVPQASDNTLFRHPLFMKMASAVSTESATGQISYPALCSKYLNLKTQRVEARLGLPDDKALIIVEKVVSAMSHNNSESIEVNEFFSMASEPIAVALLEEGLFQRASTSISVESELLFEYVISRTLPANPFETVELPTSDQNYTKPWWRAAAFKLWEIDDQNQIEETLDRLLRAEEGWLTLYVLDVFRIGFDLQKDITPFKKQFCKICEQFYFPNDGFMLLYRISKINSYESVDFVLDATRVLLCHVPNWEDWRSKKWDKLGEFDLRAPFVRPIEDVRNPTREQSAYLLHDCLKTQPYATIYLLISKWLDDSTKLQDEEAEITDVATRFLKGFASDYPREFQKALTKVLDQQIFSYTGESAICRILRWTTYCDPAAYGEAAYQWALRPEKQFQGYVFEIIGALPETAVGHAIQIVSLYLERETLPLGEANQAIATLGNVHSRKVLEFLTRYNKFSEYQSGVVKACNYLFAAFPNEVVQIVNEMAQGKLTLLRQDSKLAILEFYRYHLPDIPEDAVTFFEKLIEDQPNLHNRDIAYSIHALRRNYPVISDFVEEQIYREADGGVLELYTYYLKKVRLLSTRDVEWIIRWIESGADPYGLLGYVVLSPLPFEIKQKIVWSLDQRSTDYIRCSVNSMSSSEANALSAFAQEIHQSALYEKLSPDSQSWFTLIQQGKSPGDAQNIMLQQRWQQYQSKRKSGS